MNYQSDSIKELATALSQAQAEYPRIGKNRDGRFKYVDKNHLKKAIDPILEKHGLAVNSGMRIIDGQEVYCMTLMHSSGEYMIYASKFDPQIGTTRSQDQERGSSMTYISRYLYKEILGITIEDDMDDDDGEQQPKKEHTTNLSPKIGPDQIAQLQKCSQEYQQKILVYNKLSSLQDMTMNQYKVLQSSWNKQK